MTTNILTQTKDQFTTLIKQHKRCAVVRPTGLGKTQLFAEYARNKKSLFIVPRLALEQDIKTRFHWLSKENCTIVTYQKLFNLHKSETNLGDYFGDLDFICLDEMHRAEADLWSGAVKELLSVYHDTEVAGGSATPVRCNGIDVAETLFDNIQVDKYTLVQAINDGVLPTPTYVCSLYDFKNEFDTIDITRVIDGIDKESLKLDITSKRLEYSETLNVPSILKKHLSDIKSPMKFIVFFSDIDALTSKAFEVDQWFKEAFPTKSINTYTVHSDLEDNDQSIKEFTLKDNIDIKLLFSVDMMSEGIHIPNTTGVLLLRKTNSPILFSQQIGRCIAVGAEAPVIFDFVNNINNTFRVQQKLIIGKEIPTIKNLPPRSVNQKIYSAVKIYFSTSKV